MNDKAVRLGIIGGSGLYQVEGIENIEEIEIGTPFGKPSDNIITGELKGVKVAFVPRHGRGHYIMPSEVNSRANIFALKKIGVERIISVSAVGSMKEDIAPGHVAVVDQFFDRTRTRPSTFFGNGLVVHVAFAKPVCPVLSGELFDACREENARVHEGGTYLCMEGPQFSTLGESLIYRKWGMDVIGMTAMPEAKLAREAEICYATMALVTDYDCWHPQHEAVSVEMVINQLMENAKLAKKVLARVIPRLGEQRLPDCRCGRALENAVMTAPEKINPRTKRDLDIIIGKYI
jgi:5'-methylthioadenosine phosphorylase